MVNKVIDLEEHTSRQLGSCVKAVYEVFQSIRYGRVKEGEILSALIYGGAFPPAMVAKIENTLIHYAVMDHVFLWTKRGLLDGNANWISAHNGSKEELVCWNLKNQNFKFSRVNGYESLPRGAENRKASAHFNELQMELFEEWGSSEDTLPSEVQILHTKEWNPNEKVARVRVWAVALKQSVGLLGPRQVIFHEEIGARSAGPIEQSLAEFSIKENGLFDRALKRAQEDIPFAI